MLTAQQKPESSGVEWLKNCSFKRNLETDRDLKGDSQEGVIKKHKKKKDKKKRRREEESERKRREAEIRSNLEKKSVYEELKKKTFIEETGLSAERAFRIDNKPDKNNLAFDSLYRLHVPLYSSKQCYHLDASVRIEKKKKKAQKDLDQRYFNHRISSYVTKVKFVHLLSQHTSEDFISLSAAPDDTECPSDEPMVTDPPVDDKSLRFASFTISEPEKVQPSVKPSVQQLNHDKTQYYNEYLRNHPTDIEKWMEFIKFQEKLHHDSSSDKNENHSKAILEKKLSIIEKAIHSNPKSLNLMIQRLEMVKNIWEPERVSDEWKRMIFLYPQHKEIWIKYISFVQNHLTYFSTSKVIRIYTRCFGTLNRILEGEFQTHRADTHLLESDMIDIFYDYCCFLRNVGLTERCVASFQAMVEFNFNAPRFLDIYFHPLSEWITYFEPYWDCGDPRIGENHSSGWAKIMHSKQTNRIPDDPIITQKLNQFEDEAYQKYKSEGQIWFHIENEREHYHWLPGHTDEDVDDCDRNVLFDDIQMCLFRLRNSDSRYKLLYSFLSFMGATDDNPKSSQKRNVESVFSNTDLIQASRHSRYGDVEFCSNLFKSFLNFNLNPDQKELINILWMKYSIKILDKNNFETTFRMVKDSLNDESNRSKLVYWKICVDLTIKIRQDRNDVIKVYEEAIQHLISLQKTEDYLKLAKDYCKYLLDMVPLEKKEQLVSKNNDGNLIQDVLMTISSVIIGEKCSSITPITNLKVIRRWKDLLEEYPVDTIFLYGLFLYLTKGLKESSILFEDQLISQSSHHQLEIYEDYLQILILNIEWCFSGHQFLRDTLKRSLLVSPCHPGFLSILILLDSKSVGQSYARQYFLKPHPYDPQNIFWWCYAILFEYKKLMLYRQSCADTTIIPGELIFAPFILEYRERSQQLMYTWRGHMRTT